VSVLTEDAMRAEMRRQMIPSRLIDRAIAMAKLRGEIAGVERVDTAELLADVQIEKDVAARGVKQMRALGFIAVNYSQARASKQTPGVQDHEFFHPQRSVFLKWEVKTPTGRPSPDQVQYGEWCAACGIAYLCGTDEDLFAWLIARGIAFEEGGLLVPLPYQSSADPSV
jgi:hypothetical protein